MGKSVKQEILINNNNTFNLLENLKTDEIVGIDLFNSNEVSSPESFSSDNKNNDDDLLKDFSPLVKSETDFNIFSKEDNLDFIQNFLNNKETEINDNSDSSDNQKKTNKRKRNSKKEEVVDESCLSEKDAKRQQRLIKNRESAQASRERRKCYVKGLEDNVKLLTTKNTSLSSKVLSLEEENQILREQIEKLSRGEKIDQPILKKQKISNEKSIPKKLPLPPLQQMPFLTTQYWTGLFNGGNNPNIQTNNNNNSFGNTTPKVVLFMALFCVALFMVKPGDKSFGDNVDRKNVGRILQSVKNLPNEVEYLFSKLQKLESKEEVSKKIQETIGKINLKYDTKSDNVTFVFPKSNEEEEANEITLSKNLFSEICSKLSETKEVETN